MNVDRVEAVLRLLQRQGHIGAVAIDGSGWSLRAKKVPGMMMPPAPDASASADEKDANPNRHVVRATMVGVYRAPSQPLQPGDFISRGATVGSIDSMRILNPVTTDQGGYVLDLLLEDGDPVEFGQELLVMNTEIRSQEESR
jgi:biotin carboxyl carrier protein